MGTTTLIRIAIILILSALAASGAVVKIQENFATTNLPATLTNIIISIAGEADGGSDPNAVTNSDTRALNFPGGVTSSEFTSSGSIAAVAGISVTGGGAQYHGNAGGLSNLPSAQLTGTVASNRFPAVLPVINGMNVTDLNGANIAAGTVDTNVFSVAAWTYIQSLAGGSGTNSVWGLITGALADQTDLQAALDAKQPLDADLTQLALNNGAALTNIAAIASILLQNGATNFSVTMTTDANGFRVATISLTNFTGTGASVMAISPTMSGSINMTDVATGRTWRFVNGDLVNLSAGKLSFNNVGSVIEWNSDLYLSRRSVGMLGVTGIAATNGYGLVPLLNLPTNAISTSTNQWLLCNLTNIGPVLLRTNPASVGLFFTNRIVLTDSSGNIVGAGGALTLDASGFNGNLATTDNTVQEVAQKLDDLTAGSSDYNTNSFSGTGGLVRQTNAVMSDVTMHGSNDVENVWTDNLYIPYTNQVLVTDSNGKVAGTATPAFNGISITNLNFINQIVLTNGATNFSAVLQTNGTTGAVTLLLNLTNSTGSGASVNSNAPTTLNLTNLGTATAANIVGNTNISFTDGTRINMAGGRAAMRNAALNAYQPIDQSDSYLVYNTSSGHSVGAVDLGITAFRISINKGDNGTIQMAEGAEIGFGSTSSGNQRTETLVTGIKATADGELSGRTNLTMVGSGTFTRGVLEVSQYYSLATNVVNWNSNNLYSGIVKLMATSQSYYITNSAFGTNSLVMASILDDDSTLLSLKCLNIATNVVQIKGNAVAAADCRIGWKLISK